MTNAILIFSVVLPAIVAHQVVVTTSSCQDNPNFLFQDVEGYNCEWLAQQPESLCDWEMVSPHAPNSPTVPTTVGQVQCPASCGHCKVDTNKVYTNDVCYNPKTSQVVVSFENQTPRARDWLGIYPVLSTTESLEVGSTVHDEPIAWSWLCGVDRDGVPNEADDHDMSANCKATYNQVAFHDLPPGIYQVVLARRNDEIFAASSSHFEISGTNALTELCSHIKPGNCFDTIRTGEHCYQEGEAFSVLLQNECNILGKDDWFGFFNADDCSDADHLCRGEPVIWSMACEGEGCHRIHTQYRYHPEDILLPAGDFRVALVADKDDHGEAPYFARLLSQPMQIHPQGESCHLIEQQS